MAGSKTLITSHGRHDVVEETLTDASKVYSVVSQSDDAHEVVFACMSGLAANNLASLLQASVLDISVRDRGLA